MSEYYMAHTGAELDDAISKVKNGYIADTSVAEYEGKEYYIMYMN